MSQKSHHSDVASHTSKRSKPTSSSSSSRRALALKELETQARITELEEKEKLRQSTEELKRQLEDKKREAEAEHVRRQIEDEERKAEVEAEKRKLIEDLKREQLEVQLENEGSQRSGSSSAAASVRTQGWVQEQNALKEQTTMKNVAPDLNHVNDPSQTSYSKFISDEFSKTKLHDMKNVPTSTPATAKGELQAKATLNPRSVEFTPSVHARTTLPKGAREAEIDVVAGLQQCMQAFNTSMAMQHEANKTNLLPSTKLERFNGDYTQFAVFHNSFTWHIEKNTEDPQRRLTYLYNHLEGAPKRLIEGCLHLDPQIGYDHAWKILWDTYMNQDEIAEEYIQKVFAWKDIKAGDHEALQDYHAYLFKIQCALGRNYVRMELKETMRKLVSKLPYQLRMKFIAKHETHSFTLPALIAFVKQQVSVAKQVKYFEAERAPFTTKRSDTSKKPPLAVHAAHPVTSKCQFCNREGHKITGCHNFKKLDAGDRWKAVLRRSLCYRCLTDGHQHRSCPEKWTCGKCGTPSHHTLLHRPVTATSSATHTTTRREPVVESTAAVAPLSSTETAETVPALPVSAVSRSEPDGRTMLKLLPVIAEESSATYAFIDGGAVPTLVSRSLVTRLGIKGRKCHQVMRTECGDFTCNEVVPIRISSMDGDEDIRIEEAFVTDSISVTTDHLMPLQWVSRWSHLNDVVLQRLPEEDATVELIVGLNSSLNRHILEQRHGEESEPSAYRTKLGWVVFGPTGPKGSSAPTLVHHVRPVEDLNEIIRESTERDFWEKEVHATVENSLEDQAFLQHVSASTQHSDGKYCVGLPFREIVSMPNNKDLAVRYTESLKRRLERDPAYKESYVAQIEKYLEKDYAEPVPPQSLSRNDGRVWYLTHHAVQHPTKKKIRVVFNPKTKFKGHALNEHLLQGPDLTNSLVGVLLRFKNGRFAVTADIQEMFHQVKVPEQDRDVFRFLWWPKGDTSLPLTEYRMSSQIFGATCSPSIVNYCLRRTADDFGELYDDEVLKTMYRHFYVDNMLRAMDDQKKCVSLVQDVIRLCREGGFRLNQWTTNQKEILASIPESERDDSVATLDLNRDELPTERTLGIHWNMQTDNFTFQISVRSKPETRRGVLSVVSSLYDPLGLVAPFTLLGKMQLQEMCRLDLGWDDPMPEHMSAQWRSWIEQLPELTNFKHRRCFVPASFGTPTSYQLHHFADASQSAYGVASYIRATNVKGDVECTLLMSRARVAPLKCGKIPRLELTAATVAAQVDAKMKSELDVDLLPSVCWSDSTTVLKYLNNKRARYHTFVANRVNLIRELTDVAAWRYVGTAENPADIASRGMDVKTLLQSDMWTSGPDFLRREPEHWPVMPADVAQGTLENDPEVKQDLVVFDITMPETCFLEQLTQRYSRWWRMVRTVAWMLRLGDRARGINVRGPSLALEELQRAEARILTLVQAQYYGSEVEALTKGQKIKRSSSIIRLRPILSAGLLRVGGRLERAKLDVDVQHPVILPAKSAAVKLLVRWIHEEHGHCGQNHLLAELRTRFWVVHAHAVARSVVSGCVECRRLSCRPAEQVMASLPEARLVHDLPPFAHTGSDCFGPFMVKQGRSTVKRWGAIFTCMASRAVHVEMLESMDTDAFLNALRRFLARRGPVMKIWTDNGTNLVATERELRESLQKLDKTKIENAMTMKSIEWNFNPPYASNFGGVWERLIRSVRRALRAACREQILTDDALMTLFCEAEAVVNSRPLTRVMDDPTCLRPLSPADLLTQKGSAGPVTATTEKDLYVRRRWRQVQFLADLFWRRWLQEYVPLLQERQRWHVRRRDLKPGDIVMILDEKLPRGTWPLGRVTEVLRSADNSVRSVKLMTENGSFHRPVNKLCVLLESELEN